jgi:CheY-like chemotaxis protein
MASDTLQKWFLLLVEDDEPTRVLWKLGAQRAGVFSNVLTVNDGEQALAWINEVIRSNQGVLPDMIVSDLKMPLVDGAELVGLLKASPRTKDIPAIIITSSDLPQDERRALDAGADGFYVKMASVPAITEFFRSLPAKHPPRAANG